AASYAMLNFSIDTADPVRGALLQRMQEKATAIETALLFFELEWAAMDDDRAEELLATEGLDFARHHLRSARRYRPHLLSEPEERIFSERALTGRTAWTRLFEEQASAITVELPDATEPVSLEVAMSRLFSPDREQRRDTAERVTTALKPGLRTRAFAFNTLLADKMVEDRLRSFPNWLSSRNLANEASDESVQALVDAVRARYELPRRWYRLKAQLLGLDKLADYDRLAPVSDDDEQVGWTEARDLVLDSYGSFSPELGGLVERFFDERWIDAPVRPNKRGGAFCAYTVPSAHPYVLLNYTYKRRDVMTLAHELGHGVHQVLAAPNGALMAPTPLTLAETASVFGEMLTFRRLLEKTADPVQRKAMLAAKVEDMINTVVRQIAFYSFERKVHLERRKGELTADKLGELWMSVQDESLGPAIRLGEGYENFWTYIPHFVHSPFYVYAYAFGDCLVNSLYGVYQNANQGFVERYFAMLSAGGTKHHSELLAPFGLNARDPAFWQIGLSMIEGLIKELEEFERD
ncbi:MAG: M3 family oligoendopeptidase, partial [Microvirga sp.]